MKKKNKLPKFKNIREEAKFWDTHSFADYWDEFEDVDLVVGLHRAKGESIVFRLQKDLKDKLNRVAKAKGLNVSALARMWIAEKLQTTKV